MRPEHFRKIENKCCDKCIHLVEELPEDIEEACSALEDRHDMMFCKKHELVIPFEHEPVGIDAHICNDFVDESEKEMLESVDGSKVLRDNTDMQL